VQNTRERIRHSFSGCARQWSRASTTFATAVNAEK
jgi:hypothetical protein